MKNNTHCYMVRLLAQWTRSADGFLRQRWPKDNSLW